MPNDEIFKDFIEIKTNLPHRELNIENIYAIAADIILEKNLRDRFTRGEISRDEYESGVNPDFIDEIGVCDHCIAETLKRALGDVPMWAKRPGSEQRSRPDFLLDELGYEIEYY